ncbi:MAG: putative bifunctional diguanylate cyclase/phosphodiesterase [Fimbriimonadaceae bacterium]
MHYILSKQLSSVGIDPKNPNLDLQAFALFLKTVSDTYGTFDLKKSALEDSLATSSSKVDFLDSHDKLTGLPSRYIATKYLQNAIELAKNQRLGNAVLFLDLDDFTKVNDSYGHERGDEILKLISKRLQSCVRANDKIARTGGDEFIITLGNLRHEYEAREVAENILSALQIGSPVSGTEVICTASIGMAYTEEDDENPDELIGNADLAMRSAKLTGKCRVIQYHPSMKDAAIERLTIENHLRSAIEQEELSVVYQPLYNLPTNELIGAEALCRWKSPTLGHVSPAHFIPIAEESGLIIDIGYWVLKKVCQEMAEWRKSHKADHLVISVNLSGRQIAQGDVADRVSATLLETGLRPKNLKLEITESYLMSDSEGTIKTLESLRKLGMKLAIDDFGTGYSSLSLLSTLPVDTVKIDQSFIKNLDQDQSARVVVKAIVAIAQSMNLDVTCEGIETESQQTFVKEAGCATGQGYFFSTPLESKDFEELIIRSQNSKFQEVA